jgi:hypothetical protein
MVVPLVPCCGQFKAQQRRAVVTAGVASDARAVAQQLISPIMLHSFSSECSGKPASALPAKVIMRTEAVSHFAIGSNYIERSNSLSSKFEARKCPYSALLENTLCHIGNGDDYMLSVIQMPMGGMCWM